MKGKEKLVFHLPILALTLVVLAILTPGWYHVDYDDDIGLFDGSNSNYGLSYQESKVYYSNGETAVFRLNYDNYDDLDTVSDITFILLTSGIVAMIGYFVIFYRNWARMIKKQVDIRLKAPIILASVSISLLFISEVYFAIGFSSKIDDITHSSSTHYLSYSWYMIMAVIIIIASTLIILIRKRKDLDKMDS